MILVIIFTSYYQGNFYDPILDYVKCDSYVSCLHEATHQYDYHNGIISKSDKWKNAVDDYRLHAFDNFSRVEEIDTSIINIVFFPGIGRERIPSYNPFMISFWQGGWGGYTEIYATVAELSDGDINKIPKPLRKFYDMEEINTTMKGLGY